MQVNGPWFIEPKTQRTVLFRGVNLSGGTKLPVGVPSHEPNGFWVDYDRNVSFVGRPFPLDEADIHLQRLVDHGFNLLRFMVTWEAIEHAGPGIYDEDYLDYVIAVLEKCKAYGLKVYLNPHQDTWSRHCGGSGHPGWTHTLVGLNPAHFAETNAAIVHNVYPVPENFPKMIWNTNYQKLAAATLFTLFYAGKTLAPKCAISGMNIQDYLQQHYLDAYTQLAKRVHDNDLEGHVVIGYDTMNEPGQGYIGRLDLTRLPDDDVDFKKGLTPTPFEGMKLGMGIATQVDDWVFTWRGPKPNGRVTVDPQGKKAWLDAAEQADADQTFGWKRSEEWKAGCIWANHGIWDGQGDILQPDYFAQSNYADHWTAFTSAYSDRIRSIHHDAILFVQPPIMETPPKVSGDNLALAPHWYDGLTLVKKKWCSYNVDYINLKRGKYGTGPLRFVRALRIGEKAIRQCFVDQIETLKVEGLETLGRYPFIIGEIGIPYDMEPVKQSSIFTMLFGWLFAQPKYYPIDSPDSPQNKAMDASIQAAERNLVSYTLWTYVPDNHPMWGDLWNGEDLSIWQNEMEDVGQESDTSSETLLPETVQGKLGTSINMRDIVSLHRPHPHKIAGEPLSIVFTSPTDKQRASYDFAFKSSVDVQGPTEIYVPTVHFPMPDAPVNPTEVNISSGRYKAQSYNGKYWTLLWYCDDGGDQELRLAGPSLQLKGGF